MPAPHHAQLDSIRQRLATQFPGLEEELASIDHSLPGSVSNAHEGSFRREHNPSSQRFSPDSENASIASPRRKLAPLPHIFQTSSSSPALLVGWGTPDLSALVKEVVKAEIELYIASHQSGKTRDNEVSMPGEAAGLLKNVFNSSFHGETETRGARQLSEPNSVEGSVEKQEAGEEEQDDDEEEDWVFCAKNAFGAFIFMSITSSLPSAIVKCGPMVLVSVLIQAVFSLELALSLNSLEDPEQVCF